VEIVEVVPDSYGYTVQVPGFGFLRDVFPDPYMVRWTIADGWATSEDLPGVRIPGAPFMGTIGLSPGREALRRITAREQAALERGGFVLPPSPASAVPSDPAIAAEALRTIPPREQAGNVDIKQLAADTRLFIPVDTSGALFSAGDAHFAQGDCETCGTAIEINADPARPVRCTQRGRARQGHPRPPVRPHGLLGGAGVRHPAPVLRHDGHVGGPGRGAPCGGRHARRPQRLAQHDRPPR
jgi:acetamidase/formamidase